MCGIAGIFNRNGEPVGNRLIKAMTDAIAHRGPDDEGHYIDINIALGHRRLSIIDLSPAGHQPMCNEDGTIYITYNGEIYNFKHLRSELEARGHRFRSRTDTEVILHGYEEEGMNFVKRLNGMFAFGLWDANRRRLFLARDRYGIKPLYYWAQGTTFVFASEIKALLTHPKISADLNYNALHEYFTFQNLFRDHTLFKDIRLLPPATILGIQTGEEPAASENYWDYDFGKRRESLSFDDARDETLRLFKQAVQRQLVADVPVGSYLSGGMDSGSVVAIASQEIPRFSTFTCGFMMHTVEGVEVEYDERKDAELMANAFKTEHYEQVIGSGDLARSLEKIIWHLEDLRVGMCYPNYYIARLASKFVKVCLSGTGGDELYAGYPWRYYRVCRSLDRKTYLHDYYSYWQRLVPEDKKAQLFTPSSWRQITDRDSFGVFASVFDRRKELAYQSPEDHIANSLYFEANTFLHGLLILSDRLAMASSLEERVPFLDNDLVDFAQSIPIHHKLGNLDHMKQMDENAVQKARRRYAEFDDGKSVLRQALSGLIPKEIIDRKKQGFSAPDESWYRGENIQFVKNMLLNPHAASRDFINPAFIATIIEEHCENRINHRLLIWSFLCFEQWCRTFLQS